MGGGAIKVISCINKLDNMRKSSWTGEPVSESLCECVCKPAWPDRPGIISSLKLANIIQTMNNKQTD